METEVDVYGFLRGSSLKEKIIQAAISLSEKEGIRFTLADLASGMKISKKTIYKYFDGKEALLNEAIEYIFNDIHRQISEISKLDLSELDKLMLAVSVYPTVINLDKLTLSDMEEQYPSVYNNIKNQLDKNWEQTLCLYDSCVEKGFIKNIDREYFRAVLLGLFEKTLPFPKQREATEQCLKAVFFGFARRTTSE